MSKKIGICAILILNIVGIICLIYFALPYFVHDTAVSNPNAMLPAARWDASGMVLTIGLIPLTVVNVLALILVGKGKIKKPLRVLFLIPCIVCLGIVAHYWITSIGAGANTAIAEPVVKVKIESMDTSDIQYSMLYDDGGMEILDEAFATDMIPILEI